MLLSENNSVINALKIILEGYEYLEYDERRSEGVDVMLTRLQEYRAHLRDPEFPRHHFLPYRFIKNQ